MVRDIAAVSEVVGTTSLFNSFSINDRHCLLAAHVGLYPKPVPFMKQFNFLVINTTTGAHF